MHGSEEKPLLPWKKGSDCITLIPCGGENDYIKDLGLGFYEGSICRATQEREREIKIYCSVT